jgi:hypothetical protein
MTPIMMTILTITRIILVIGGSLFFVSPAFVPMVKALGYSPSVSLICGLLMGGSVYCAATGFTFNRSGRISLLPTPIVVIFTALVWGTVILGYFSTDLPLWLKIWLSVVFALFIVVPSFDERQNLRQ